MLFRCAILLSLASWAGWQSAPPVTADFRIATGGIELAATLTVPDGPGPHPAVVLLSGSGPSTRQNLRKFSDRFNDDGFATLVFDKRGSGQSTGSWANASFDDNVRDAQAAIDWLIQDSRLDHRRIGIWGVSQVGWFIPAIANRSPSLAFAIVLTGGGATPREVEMFMHEASLDRANVTPEDRGKAREMLNAYFDWLGTGVNRQGVVALIERARPERWYAAVALDGVMPSDAGRPNWTRGVDRLQPRDGRRGHAGVHGGCVRIPREYPAGFTPPRGLGRTPPAHRTRRPARMECSIPCSIRLRPSHFDRCSSPPPPVPG